MHAFNGLTSWGKVLECNQAMHAFVMNIHYKYCVFVFLFGCITFDWCLVSGFCNIWLVGISCYIGLLIRVIFFNYYYLFQLVYGSLFADSHAKIAIISAHLHVPREQLKSFGVAVKRRLLQFLTWGKLTSTLFKYTCFLQLFSDSSLYFL